MFIVLRSQVAYHVYAKDSPEFADHIYPISPSGGGERLALNLRYLASGDSMVSMSYAFRIGTSTVSHIIRETCNCIWDSLNQIVLKQASEEMWLSVAQEFDERW
ncbi:hypothetical protein JTB14_009258 [Gonioctena quinquepunctata]|nr:hypothetical protein JTB14_009258 [Gonioctena quinquepunctata]